jgi:exosortase H (IPTLxxWG-CTERM-specific)
MTNEPPKRSRRAAAGFIVRFFILLAVLYGVMALDVVDRTAIASWTHGIAVVSGAMLNAVGQGVTVAGTIVTSSFFSVSIQNGCNGLEATIFLIAAVLAFPATWRQRAAGAAIGFALIQLLNLMRVVTLFLLGRYKPELFEVAHLAIWQTIIAGVTIFFFHGWSVRARRIDVADAA